MGLGSRLRAASEALLDAVREFYVAHGLPFEPRWFPLVQLLRQLDEAPSAATAAKRLGVSHTAVQRIAREMTHAGLITLEAHSSDRRAKVLRFTDAGHQLAQRAEPAWFALRLALDTRLRSTGVLEALAALEGITNTGGVRDAVSKVLSRDYVKELLRIVPFNPLDQAHRDAFVALNREWLEHYFAVEPQDQVLFKDPYSAVVGKGGRIIIATVGTRAVGTAALVPHDDGIFELGRLAVARVYQNKGIGTLLTDTLLNEARSMGLKNVYLVTNTVLPYAVPLYRKLGFVESKRALHLAYERANLTMQIAL